ncbi:MAG TPA: hypothetical protein VFK13_10045 [Gemmatimonadaceae bacterium]|nr:hypothetical protein [Gemmatimonadaceae bacterium]
MQTSMRRAVLPLAAIAGLLLSSCGQEVPILHVPSNCVVKSNDAWFLETISVIHEQPAVCPVKVVQPGDLAFFQAFLTAPSTFLNFDQGTSVLVTVDTYDNFNLLVDFFNFPLREDEGELTSTLAGNYHAAVAGFGLNFGSNVTLHDSAVVGFHTVAGTAAPRASVDLPYIPLVSTDLEGPGVAQEGTQFELTAWLNPNLHYVAPLTYEWFLNGVSLGPPRANYSSMTDWARAEGTTQNYLVRITDATGGFLTAEHSVVITTGEGNGTCLQPPCP